LRENIFAASLGLCFNRGKLIDLIKSIAVDLDGLPGSENSCNIDAPVLPNFQKN